MRIYFKELKQVEEVTGWGKMYYCFYDLDRYDSSLLLNYLIDSEPIPEGRCFDEGYEDYLRYSDSFIQQRLGAGLTNHIINACLNDLVSHNYIYVYLGKDRNARGFKTRFIKLNYNKIADAMGIDLTNDLTNDSTNDSTNGLTNGSKNLKQNRIQNNKETDKQINNIPSKEGALEDTSIDNIPFTVTKEDNVKDTVTVDSSVDNKTVNKTSKNYKDILSTIYSYDFSERLTNELITFFESNKGCFTVQQVKAKIEDLQKISNNNESLEIEAIHNAFVNGWKAFYLPNKSYNKRPLTEYERSAYIQREEPEFVIGRKYI